MGRHSGSRDDEDEAAIAPAADEPAATLTGRHARVEEPQPSPQRAEEPQPSPQRAEEPLVSLDEVDADDGPLGVIAEQMTQPEPAVPVEDEPDPALPAPRAEPLASVPDPAATSPAAARPARGNQSTAADLALLREHSAVRARVIAALVVPFVLYTAVLLLIGALGVYLIWVWIPLVSGGVVAGLILDVEHRRRDSAGR
jgi:hypothetical protein